MRGKAAGRYSPARRGGSQSDEDTNRWLGTYGDAVTLLMAFFVMLYAMSQIDQIKFDAFVSGLQAPFGNPGSAQSPLEGDPSIVGDAQPALVPALERSDVVAAPQVVEAATVESVAVEGPDLVQLEEVKRDVEEALEAVGKPDVAAYHFDARGLVVSIAADGILFDTGSSTVSREGRNLIGAIAGPLRSAPNDIFIEGHTDDVPLNRAGYTNWNLSTDRAVAVLTLLHGAFEVPQQRLGAVGYGEFRPLVANTSAGNRSKNRRVDILVVALDTE